MQDSINKLLTPRKGLLAADESTHTIEKRFAELGLISTPELNRKYREMLFTTPGIENFISGVILFEETVEQGLQKILEEKGILPGIKLDGGLEPYNDTEEQVTKGLSDLEGKTKKYVSLGLKFSKWRGVFMINDKYPSDAFCDENLSRMAKYAKISQDAGLTPIVEPEVLLDGIHTTTRSSETIDKVLTILFEKLKSERVDLTKIILKTSMALPGKDNGVIAEPLEVANATLRALKRSVPREVPGIVFLSGGQTPEQATANLNEIVKLRGDAPWQLSFSFARALQSEAMKEWGGKDENIKFAQEIFIKRLEMVSKARKGEL